MDHRTVADYQDPTSYRYEGNDGGMSWSTPWLASMYALAKQADPNLTPEKFWTIAKNTSDACNNNDTGENVGRILNSGKLIEEVERLKDSQEPLILDQGIIKADVVMVKNKEGMSLRRQKPTAESRQQNLEQEYNILKEKYKFSEVDILLEDNEYGDIAYRICTKTITD